MTWVYVPSLKKYINIKTVCKTQHFALIFPFFLLDHRPNVVRPALDQLLRSLVNFSSPYFSLFVKFVTTCLRFVLILVTFFYFVITLIVQNNIFLTTDIIFFIGGLWFCSSCCYKNIKSNLFIMIFLTSWRKLKLLGSIPRTGYIWLLVLQWIKRNFSLDKC